MTLTARLVLAAGILLQASSAHAQISISPVLISGQPAAGQPAGTTYAGFSQLGVSPNGHLAFVAALTGGGTTTATDSAIYRVMPTGSVEAVVREGSAASYVGAGISLGTLNPNFPLWITDTGTVFADILLTGAGVVSTNNRVYLRVLPAATPIVIARTGSPAPGGPSGGVYSFLSNLNVDPSVGTALFAANLTGGSITLNNDRGLWTHSNTTQLLLSEGTQAPGQPAGVVYDDFSSIIPGSSSNLAMVAFLRGSGVNSGNDTLLLTGSVFGGLIPIVREGQAAPTLPGVTIADIGSGPFLTDGTVFYGSLLAGSGVTTLDDEALWQGSTPVLRENTSAPGTGGTRVFTGLVAPRVQALSTGEIALSAFLRDPAMPTMTATAGLWTGLPSSLALIAREGNQAPGLPAGVNFSRFDRMSLDATGNILVQCQLAGAGVNSSNAIAIYAYKPGTGMTLVARAGSPLTLGPGDTRTVLGLTLPGRTNEATGNPKSFGNGKGYFIALFSNLSSALLEVNFGPVCDAIDFNNDGVFPDTGDLDDFLSVYGGGPCSTDPTPGCNDLDFNNDGVFPDTSDIDSLLSVYGGGPCL
jgi:hypothetical protein